MGGKENIKSPRVNDFKRVSHVVKSPLQVTTSQRDNLISESVPAEAEIVPPPTGKQLPRTPVIPPADFIPRGNNYLLYPRDQKLNHLLSILQVNRFPALHHPPPSVPCLAE